MSDYSLQPFVTPASTPPPNLKIVGNISRHANTLVISYEILGDLAQLTIPTLAVPTRKHELWAETCLEFFLGIKNSPDYWEFNLSPAGHWNVYRFTHYRQGMQEEIAFESLPFSVQNLPNSLSLVLEINLDKIVQANLALEVGISAVIKTKDGEVTYWALTHPSLQADFHRRDSFIVQL